MELALATVQTWCPWCGEHHAGWGGWGMMFGWTLLLVLLVLGAWFVMSRSRASGGDGGPGPSDGAEEALRERFARGEIDEETYRSRLEELRRS